MSFRTVADPKRRFISRYADKALRALQTAYAEEKADRGLTQTALAEILDVDRSVVHRRLLGHGNMTLNTILEMAFALGREPIVEYRRRPRLAMTNQFDNIRISASSNDENTLTISPVRSNDSEMHVVFSSSSVPTSGTNSI